LRFTVYRLSPYPFEPQFAATEPRELIAPIFTSNDLQASKFAAILWARWLDESAHIWDEQAGQWIFNVNSSAPLNAAQALTPALRPAAIPFRPPVMR
jgi:hypothetical protein